MDPDVRRAVLGWTLACAALLLWSCAGVQETQTTSDGNRIPSDGLAQQALNEGLARFNEACVVPDMLERGETFPVTIVEPDTLQPPVRYQQLLALQQQGLLTNQTDTTSAGLVRRTFALTEKGQQAQSEIFGFRGWRSGICYATPRVTRIDSIAAVPDRSPRPIAEVRFHHALQNVQPWARTPRVQRLFPTIRPILEDAGTPVPARRTLIETEDGWTDSRLVGRPAPTPEGS